MSHVMPTRPVSSAAHAPVEKFTMTLIKGNDSNVHFYAAAGMIVGVMRHPENLTNIANDMLAAMRSKVISRGVFFVAEQYETKISTAARRALRKYGITFLHSYDTDLRGVAHVHLKAAWKKEHAMPRIAHPHYDNRPQF